MKSISENVSKSLLLACVLCVSFFFPPTRIVWDLLDIHCFLALNAFLKHAAGQMFWALFNHRYADWLEDLVLLLFIIAAVRSVPPPERRHKIVQFLSLAFLILCTIKLFNRGLLHAFPIVRPSPSHLFPECIRLSQEIPWMKIKDCTLSSFPGDHATTALLFASGYATLAPRKLAVPAAIYCLFLTLPRLVTGAHWLSDIAIGSGTIALIFFPLYRSLTQYLAKRLRCKTGEVV